MSIESFRHKGLEELFIIGKSAKIDKRLHKTIVNILDHLESIVDLDDCVGVRGFHELKGDRRGVFAMFVTGNYRITFSWEEKSVTGVDFEDYH